MFTTRLTTALLLPAMLAACAVEVPTHVPEKDLGMFWVKHAAEYGALTRQVYASAARDLDRFIEDPDWSALPGQENAGELPPAVILDVDETVITNVDFQISFERPFDNYKLDQWDRDTVAQPVPGVVEFVAAARDRGATVFFLTNRPCEPYPGTDDPCSQKQTVIDGLTEIGIDTDPQYVSLANERPEWQREKLVRREHIGRDYRVIMLVGDDLADFVPCARKSVYAPCTAPGTRASRAAALEEYSHLWGNGWYILPNPMHGSWTEVR